MDDGLIIDNAIWFNNNRRFNNNYQSIITKY